jgi:hypothetical protein
MEGGIMLKKGKGEMKWIILKIATATMLIVEMNK